MDDFKEANAKLSDPKLTVGAEISTKFFMLLSNSDDMMPIGIDRLGRIWKQDRGKIVCVGELDAERNRRITELRLAQE